MVPTEDPTFRVADLIDDSYDAAFFGHYHLPQELEGPAPSFYGGSLFVSQYGEDFSKGWLMFDTESKEASRFTVDQTPKLVAEVTVQDGEAGSPSLRPHEGRFTLKALKGADVKLVVSSTSDERTAATEVGAQLKAKYEKHARSVKVVLQIEKVVRAREGAEKIAGLPTIKAKVEAYYDRIIPKPTAGEVEDALVRLERIERELDEVEA
jgi:hypothetical protein